MSKWIIAIGFLVAAGLLAGSVLANPPGRRSQGRPQRDQMGPDGPSDGEGDAEGDPQQQAAKGG